MYLYNEKISLVLTNLHRREQQSWKNNLSLNNEFQQIFLKFFSFGMDK